MNKLIKVYFVLIFVIGFYIISFKDVYASTLEQHNHTYDNGICSCGEYEEPEWNQHINGGWEVSNAGQLMWVASKYNAGEINSNIFIINDITLPVDVKWTPIGTVDYPFTRKLSTHNDTVKTVNLNNQEVRTSNYGLIGYASTGNNYSAKISNIQVSGEFNISSSIENVGAIVGVSNENVSITNCTSFVNINVLSSGAASAKIGGILGSNIGTTYIDSCANYGDLILEGVYESAGGIVGLMSAGTISNVINYGHIVSNTTKYLGGILGYMDNQLFEGISNACNIGKVEGKSFSISVGDMQYEMNPGDIAGYIGYHKESSIFNNYYINDTAYGVSSIYDLSTTAQKVSDDDIKSGKLANLLGNKFGQKIDNLLENESMEEYPKLGSEVVYQVYECDAKTIKYSNFNKNTDHVYIYNSIDNIIYQSCEHCSLNKKVELIAPKNPYFDKTLKEVTLNSDIDGIDLSKIKINYNVEPIFPGKYMASIEYEGLNASLEFEILKGIPQADMLIFNEPENELVYDGNDKILDVVKTNEQGLGEIIVQFSNTKYGILSKPRNAGLYVTRVKVLEGELYQAHEFDGLDFIHFITIKQKEITVEWTKTILFFEDGKNYYTPEFVFHGTVNGEKPKPNINGHLTGKGTTNTTISVYDDNYVLVGDNLTIEFTVKGKLVAVPKIPYAIIKNGVTQKADIEDTELYKVVTNNGGQGNGKYPVVLELKNPEEYTWETTDDAQITIYFYIYSIKSEWEQFPTIEDWTYGQKHINPVYKVKDSYLDIYVKYRPINGVFSNNIPTEVGEYEVLFTSETEDFRSSPLEDVILKFEIKKAEPICLISSTLNIKYGKSLSDISLIGYGEGTWKFKSLNDEVLKAGVHEVEVVFTPYNTVCYNEVTKTMIINVEKLDTEYIAPTIVEGLIYNASYQSLIIPGGTINGIMYYKVNDGNWGKDVPIMKNAGTYTIYYKVVGNENYKDVEEQSLVVTIGKINLTIKADNYSIEQYTELPKLTYSTTGLLKTDYLDVEPNISVNIDNSNVTGTYDIIIEDAVTTNYDITYLSGTLTITEHTECRGGSATCTEKAHCILCGKLYGNLAEHTFINYKYNDDATTDKDGTMTSVCEHCETTKTIIVANTKIAKYDKSTNKIWIGILIGIIPTITISAGLYLFIIKKKFNK